MPTIRQRIASTLLDVSEYMAHIFTAFLALLLGFLIGIWIVHYYPEWINWIFQPVPWQRIGG